jgi:hypothetical protein
MYACMSRKYRIHSTQYSGNAGTLALCLPSHCRQRANVTTTMTPELPPTKSLLPAKRVFLQDWTLLQLSWNLIEIRVARWFVFKTKILIWVNFGGPWIGKCLCTYVTAVGNILWRFGIFYDHLVNFLFIWYIFSGLVSCTKKNLATLIEMSPKGKKEMSTTEPLVVKGKVSCIFSGISDLYHSPCFRLLALVQVVAYRASWKVFTIGNNKFYSKNALYY